MKLQDKSRHKKDVFTFSFIILIIVVKYLLGISFRKIYYFLKKERVMMKINKTISWSFEQLENRLKMKLSYLAIIPVKKRLYNNEIYYKYHNPKIYKFKDFYTFLELLRTGVIRINMKIGFYTSEEKYGKIQDKGTAFEIQDKDIEKLFTIIS